MISLAGVSPALGEKLVALDSTIEFTLVSSGTGFDISTLIVDIKCFRAVTGTTFKTGFNGILSSITPDGVDFIVVIDPESEFRIGKVYDVKLTGQSLVVK